MPRPPARGLEVGVGSGKFAVPLGIRIGVEPSEKMAIKAERQGVRVLRHVAEELPFPGAEFDFVLMVTTVCVVDDILKQTLIPGEKQATIQDGFGKGAFVVAKGIKV